jgi:hypothetical protein
MPAAADNKHIEGLGGQRDRGPTAQQKTLSGSQNEVAKLKNPIFGRVHYTTLGNLQEKNKAFPKTSACPPFDHSVASESALGPVLLTAASGPGVETNQHHGKRRLDDHP